MLENRYLAVLVAVSTMGPVSAQVPPPKNSIKPIESKVDPLPVPDTAPDEVRRLVQELATEGVTVDFDRRVVEVKGVALLDKMNAGYPIEYLMVTEGGFTHEALCLVRCTPSRLNAAFLALGLTPGKTVQYVKKDPPPPEEKLISGEESEFNVLPPEGAIVDISARWTAEDGTEKLHPIEDLISYTTNENSLPRRGFVYVGSRFGRMVIGVERKERFIADMEGNIVSLYVTGAGTCLFDMNSAEGAEAYLYDINVAMAPKAGSPVTFVFALR